MKSEVMKKYSLITLILVFSISILCKGQKPVDYVDPFITTQGDHGHWHPAALVPFGLVKLGPDTYPGSLTADGDFAHSGYDYSDNQIRGFSHFRKGSSGGTAICDRAGLLSIIPFANKHNESFFKSPVADIDKTSEKAKPGYYSVQLDKEQILAELTSSIHVGLHRYTFPKGKNAKLYLYEGNQQRSVKISGAPKGAHVIEGEQQTYYGSIFFTVHFNLPIADTKTWCAEAIKDTDELDKQDAGGWILDFGDLKGKQLLVKVGVSHTSIEAARNNLESECPGWNFASLQKKSNNDWNEVLKKIIVEGDKEYKTIFYTALYHTCFLPVNMTDAEGTYPGLDRKNHKADGYIHYDNYAFWDSFRTKYPLYSLFQPAVYRDIVKSLSNIYKQADNWDPFPNSEHPPHGEKSFLAQGKDGYLVTSTCRHEHMIMVMADAYFKGLFDVDVQEVYPYLKQEVLLQMPEKYDKIGFIPKRPDQTGEYCWDNWCLAQVAKDIGKQEDYQYFMKRADYWKNTWDSSIKYFRARAADGSWLDFPEDPAMNREKYTYEGSKWHWRWNVLHDMPALISAFGGEEAFVKELSYFFDNDLYTAGNQIDLQAPFLFNYSGAPWLTQKWVRKILTEPIVQKYGTHDFFPEPIFDRVYKATPDGYLEEMDDDYGCMSGWFAMSAMGLFQVCPGDPVYQITAPIFKSVKIELDDSVYPGKEFTIKAAKLSKTNMYIQSARLNGKPLNRSWISHEELVNGGELIFEMGPEPNKVWGTD